VPKYQQIAPEVDRRRKAGEGFDRLAREMKVNRPTVVRAYDFANRDEAAAAAALQVERGVPGGPSEVPRVRKAKEKLASGGPRAHRKPETMLSKCRRVQALGALGPRMSIAPG
jgi:hypothetical protein